MNRLDAIKSGESLEATPATKGRKLRLSMLLPLSVFLLITVLLGIGLFMDPKLVPSPLIGKSVPEFSLQPVQGRKSGLAREDLMGVVSMVNVFASWCVACRQEHPLLMEVSRHRGDHTIVGRYLAPHRSIRR